MTEGAAESTAGTDTKVDGIDKLSVDDAEKPVPKDVKRIKVKVTKESVDHGRAADSTDGGPPP